MLTGDQLYAILYPKNDDQFYKILSGYDRGFMKQFLGAVRAIARGDFAALRRRRKNNEPYYDTLTGSWRGADGQYLPAEKQIRSEIKRLEKQLVDLTRRYLRDKVRDNHDRPTIPGELLEEWQRKAAQIIINGNIRAYSIGKGSELEYDRISAHVKSELNFLENFSKDIEQNTLKRYSIVDRIGMYADSVLLGFSQGDINGRSNEEWEGWRRLDPSAAHCPECPTYATDGYVNPSEIMPIGCCSSCMRNCRCTITWRRKKEVYYQDLLGINANLLDRAQLAEINFKYYKRLGLDTKAEARRYVILKRSLGHQGALEQVLKEKNALR